MLAIANGSLVDRSDVAADPVAMGA